jgi:hypothetical protein
MGKTCRNIKGTRNAYTILCGNLKEREYLENLTRISTSASLSRITVRTHQFLHRFLNSENKQTNKTAVPLKSIQTAFGVADGYVIGFT